MAWGFISGVGGFEQKNSTGGSRWKANLKTVIPLRRQSKARKEKGPEIRVVVGRVVWGGWDGGRDVRKATNGSWVGLSGRLGGKEG